MRKVGDSYNSENIAEAIIFIIIKIGVVSKLGYFIINNATICDIAIKIIL
jgi:hypothetical protein